MNKKVLLSTDELKALVLGDKISGNTPTELYVSVIQAILKNYPDVIGKKETHFTCDKNRGEQYTGTTRSTVINGNTVYIKTGFSTKDKWKGIEKTCQLAGIDCLFEDSIITTENSHSALTDKQDSDIQSMSNKDCHSAEISDKELNFAFHSEYYKYYERGDFTECKSLSSSSCDYNGFMYIRYNKSFYCDESEERVSICGICKIDKNENISLIKSNSIDFCGEFGVNRHGIFVWNNNKVTLFDEEGNERSKISICKSDSIYIYDSKIYALDMHHTVYEYDIFDKCHKKLLWSFKDHRSEIKDILIKELISNGYEAKNLKNGITTTIVENVCVFANDKYIIYGFSFLNEKFGDRPKVYICCDIETSNWYYLQLVLPASPVKIFSFDMKNSLIWWCREINNNKYLFNTPIQQFNNMINSTTDYQYLIRQNEDYDSFPYELYFDGNKAYYSTSNSFYALARDGKYNLWIRSEYSGGISFSVLEQYVYSDRIDSCYIINDIKLYPHSFILPDDSKVKVYNRNDLYKLIQFKEE